MKQTLFPFFKAPALKISLLAGLVAAYSAPVFSMTSLSEDELSIVSGQDGLSYGITAPQILAEEYTLTTDSGVTAKAGGIRTGALRMTTPDGSGNMTADITLDAGASASGPAISIIQHIDRFRLGGNAGQGYISALIADPANTADAERNFGEWALVTDIDFSLTGQPLIPGGKSNLHLAYTDGTLFYRQNAGHATLIVDDLNFLWNTQDGEVNITSEGLRLASAATEFRIRFDVWMMNGAAADTVNDMTKRTDAARPGIRYSWGGNLYDAVLFLRSGGIWNTATDQFTNVAFKADGSGTNDLPTGMSEGVNLGMRWNYRSSATPNVAGDFLWSIGHIKGNRNVSNNLVGDQEALEFGDWRNLEQASGAVSNRYGFDIPLLIYDAISAGSASNAGGALCWGNTMTGAGCSSGGGSLLSFTAGTVDGYTADVNRTGGALFMQAIRNGNLLAWSNRVRVKHIDQVTNNTVYEDTAAFGGNNDGTGYSWGLVSTLANINANIYFYPGSSESAGSNGRKQGAIGDLLFMSQSFGEWANPNGTCRTNPGHTSCNTEKWSKGTHFMIADTAAEMGIGILGGGLLLAADDLRLWLKDSTTGTNGHLAGGLDLFSPRVRYNAKGLFGGARLPNGHDLIRIAEIDMNLEGLLNYRISPTPKTPQAGKTAESNDYLASSAAIRLRCGTLRATAFGCNDKSGWAGSNIFSDITGATMASGLGSYISISEPGKPGIDLRLADLSGDLAIAEGILQMRTAADTNADAAPGASNKNQTTRADLTIANKIMYGASAASRMLDGVTGSSLGEGGPAGRPVTSNLQFGSNDILSMAIPAMSTYYSLTLRAQ